MKSTFPVAEAPVEQTAPKSAIVPAPGSVAITAAPSAPVSFFNNEGMEGEFDRSDLQIPGLNLVQGVGPLSETFTPGQMVYNKEEIVCEPCTAANEKTHLPAEVTVLKIRKSFQEKLPYGSEVLPRRFNTQAEARAAGLVPPWEKKNYAAGEVGVFEPILECEVLLGGKSDEHPTWPFEFGGKRYAKARWIIKSTAYSTVGKIIISAAGLGLRDGLHTGYWHITPKREKVGDNMVWIPRSKLAGKHAPEFLAWVKELL